MYKTLEQYNYSILFLFFKTFFIYFIKIWYNIVDGDEMKNINIKNIKNALIGIFVIALYMFASSMPVYLLNFLGINYISLTLIQRAIYLVSYQAVLTLIIIYIYRKDFIPNLKDFIKNNIQYFKKYIKYWFYILALMFISNIIIINFTTTNISNNQTDIIATLKAAPIYTFIVTVIIAPFLEELVFRLSFRKIFAHTDTLFILVSGLVFGSMHVIGNFNNLIDLLFIIPYSIPGLIFAYIYCKSKNICVPISIHLIHNGVLMMLQILITFLPH